MLRATQAFHATVDGVDRFVPAGELVADDDPVVAGRESLFTQPDVEQSDQQTRRRTAKTRG